MPTLKRFTCWVEYSFIDLQQWCFLYTTKVMSLISLLQKEWLIINYHFNIIDSISNTNRNVKNPGLLKVTNTFSKLFNNFIKGRWFFEFLYTEIFILSNVSYDIYRLDLGKISTRISYYNILSNWIFKSA